MNRLRELRENAGFSQCSLAARLGLTPPTINRWERGRACPRLQNLKKLADLYGVSVREMKEAVKDGTGAGRLP